MPDDDVVRAEQGALVRRGYDAISHAYDQADGHKHGHPHGHGPMDDARVRALVGHAELEGETLLAFVTETVRRLAALRPDDAGPVRTVLDIGSGPGVGTCELARQFPAARVTAVDISPAMLERVVARAAELGCGDRVDVLHADVAEGLPGVEGADVIWASLSLHHVGDEVAALRRLRDLLRAHGLLAVAEIAEPLRLLPEDAGVGVAGLFERLDDAGATWFAEMRAGLPGLVPSADLETMLDAAGLAVVDSYVARERIGPPPTDDVRRFALGYLRASARRLEGQLGPEHGQALATLTDADDPRSVAQRDDLLVSASRRIAIARPKSGSAYRQSG